MLSKLAAFTPEEIESVGRAILLTARELEPYFIYQRGKAEHGLDLHWSTPEDLVEATTKIYFSTNRCEVVSRLRWK